MAISPEWVALGTPEEHERVKKGLEALLAKRFAEYQICARELQLLRHDLGYMTDILEKALGDVRDEEVQDGVCHECPYPELMLPQ